MFGCRDGSTLTVYYQPHSATLLVDGQTYALRRKPSNVGKHFAARQATLIIDGDFAAFVADDLNHLRGCRLAPD